MLISAGLRPKPKRLRVGLALISANNWRADLSEVSIAMLLCRGACVAARARATPLEVLDGDREQGRQRVDVHHVVDAEAIRRRARELGRREREGDVAGGRQPAREAVVQ